MSEFGPGGWNANSSPVDVALTQLGVRETAPNRGPEVDEYLRSCGLDPTKGSYPWCVAFVRWSCSRVGVWLPRTASVKRLFEMAGHLRVKTPQLGDIALHLRPDGKGHCAFFLRQYTNGAGQWVSTVDGNSNASGSREGDRVVLKDRPAGFWNSGYIRPQQPEKVSVS